MEYCQQFSERFCLPQEALLVAGDIRSCPLFQWDQGGRGFLAPKEFPSEPSPRLGGNSSGGGCGLLESQ